MEKLAHAAISPGRLLSSLFCLQDFLKKVDKNIRFRLSVNWSFS